jgi:peptide chain release factor subunit 1
VSASPKDPQLARYEFKRMVEEIASIRGRATELVTLYVPPGRAISEVSAYLRNEYAQAGNIKSRTTRKSVLSALETIINRLKQYRTAPEHGVAFFVGAKPIGADKSEQVVYAIEPPEPLNTYMYRCDSQFVVDPLLAMIHEPELWGLLVIDRAEATFGFLRGKRVEALRNKQSQVPSKHGRGGQSAHRFERLIEHAAHEFFVRCAEIAGELFLPVKDSLKGILVGGPGSTKDFFVKEHFLHYELQAKVVEPLFDTGYTDEYGLRELVEKASVTLRGLEVTAEKKLVQRLLLEIRKTDQGLAAYGEADVLRALSLGAVETVLLSEGLRKKRVTLRCGQCGEVSVKTLDDALVEERRFGPCPKCGSTNLSLESVEDFVGRIFEEAASHSSEVRMISSESEEGGMLLKAFGGLAALLRYPLPPSNVARAAES